jgi:hypothetical protein
MPVNIPLYQQEIRIPDWKSAPLTKSCQMVGGQNGEPQNFSPDWHRMGTSDCRMSKGEKVRHRIPVAVKPTSGKIDAAKRGVAQSRTYSKREKRALAVAVLRKRGEKINEKSIQGILSGKTL